MAKKKGDQAPANPELLHYDRAGIDRWLNELNHVEFRFGAFGIVLHYHNGGKIVVWIEFKYAYHQREYGGEYGKKEALVDALSYALAEMNRAQGSAESTRNILLEQEANG